MKTVFAFLLAASLVVGAPRHRGTMIDGRVVGLDGAPVRSAHVDVYHYDRDSAVASAVCTTKGVFTCPVPGRGAMRVVCGAEGYQSVTAVIVDGLAAAPHVDVRLAPRTTDFTQSASTMEWSPRAVAEWIAMRARLDSITGAFQSAVKARDNAPQAITEEVAARMHVLDLLLHVTRRAAVKQLVYMKYVEFGQISVMNSVGRATLGKPIGPIGQINSADAVQPDYDTAVVRQALRAIPVTSPLWEFNPGIIVLAVAELDESAEARQYMERVLARHYSRDVKAQVLFNALQWSQLTHREHDAIEYYDDLVNMYAESKYARAARENLAPERRIRAGNTVPAFQVRALDDSSLTISDSTLRGSYTLIDFWAVWCAPCVAELHALHDAYEHFKDRHFTILSVSFDRDPQRVTAFRADRWKMPWLHAWADGAFGSAVATAFEVHAIPKPVLVGPDGKILATDLDLRGARLEQTLETLVK